MSGSITVRAAPGNDWESIDPMKEHQVEGHLRDLRDSHQRIEQKLDRIERSLDLLARGELALLREERTYSMATAETLQRLQDDIRTNTDAVTSVQQALTTYAQTVADLTQKLQDAIAGGDETAIAAAADALEANNKALMDAAPATAQAATANTPAASA